MQFHYLRINYFHTLPCHVLYGDNALLRRYQVRFILIRDDQVKFEPNSNSV